MTGMAPGSTTTPRASGDPALAEVPGSRPQAQGADSLTPGGEVPLPHLVSTAPFDRESVERMTVEQERFFLASQWKMMWWRFRTHRLAVWSGVFLLILYASIFFSEFLAPYALHSRHMAYIFAPPQRDLLVHHAAH